MRTPLSDNKSLFPVIILVKIAVLSFGDDLTAEYMYPAIRWNMPRDPDA